MLNGGIARSKTVLYLLHLSDRGAAFGNPIAPTYHPPSGEENQGILLSSLNL